MKKIFSIALILSALWPPTTLMAGTPTEPVVFSGSRVPSNGRGVRHYWNNDRPQGGGYRDGYRNGYRDGYGHGSEGYRGGHRGGYPGNNYPGNYPDRNYPGVYPNGNYRGGYPNGNYPGGYQRDPYR